MRKFARTKLSLFLGFVGMVISQEDSNDINQRFKPFDVYWNVPTFQCDYHKLNFTGLFEKYGIIANENARFYGEEIVILYDPGSFPAILKTVDNSRIVLRNGGVPQEGNLTMHLELFQVIVDALIPNENFTGVAVIDFESWRPIYRQNFGSLQPYKDLSLEVERQLHPYWPKSLLEKDAVYRFEHYGRIFMEDTLLFAKMLRPGGKWGYYAYPYCFNMSPKNMKTDCPNEVVKENERMEWLYNITDNLHPSLYLSESKLTAEQKMQMVEGRINEAHRIVNFLNKTDGGTEILPYFWYKYQDTKEFLSKEDLRNMFFLLKASDCDGFIIWGSSNDVNNKQKCLQLFDYVDKILGPILIGIR